MKRLLPIFPLLLILTATLVAYPVYRQLQSCFLPFKLPVSTSCLSRLSQIRPLLNRLPSPKNVIQLLDASQPFWPHQDYLLGYRPSGTTYLILLQNDNELRANGGFFGSYAVITLKNGQ